MIASLTGLVKSVGLSSIVIEVGGVGILVYVAPRLAASLSIGRVSSLHTTLLVREDALTLYGFERSEDRELFELLQTVTGIGPKVAQSALNVYETPQLLAAIFGGDTQTLEKISGLGKKGAQRLILELKEKVQPGVGFNPTLPQTWRDQLNEALLSLGFTAKESFEAIAGVAAERPDASTDSVESLLKCALQLRGRRS